jgi:hypothetical protein
MADQPVARPLPGHRTAQTQNKRSQTSMPQMGFELTIPVFERAKTVHALDCAATVIGDNYNYDIKLIVSLYSSLTESSETDSPSPNMSDNWSRVVATSRLYTIGQIRQ